MQLCLIFFEKSGDDIGLEALEAAVDICFWYSDEFLRMFVSLPQEEVDAHELNAWLQVKRESGERVVAKNSILQKGPNQLRKVKRLDPAIDVLLAQEKILLSRFLRNDKLRGK